MEPHQDEQITCTSCGTSFVFPADMAAARAARGMTTPPTLCKPCWREKKAKEEPNAGGARQRGEQNAEPRPPRRPHDERSNRPRPVRYTGDVNEYRSPMADPHFPSHAGYGRPGHHGGLRNRSAQGSVQGDGNYRAPSFRDQPSRDEQGRSSAPRQTPRNTFGPRPASGPSYPITCATCGAKATVPFKPNENQKVFCRACYRSEKPT